MPKISPKLAAAIAPPLTAVTTAAILSGTLDRASLAALAGVAIGALLGYHAPGLVQSRPLGPPMTFGTTGAMAAGPATFQTTGTATDPALDDPDHVSDEPEIPAEALTGRRAESTRTEDHTGLGDPS